MNLSWVLNPLKGTVYHIVLGKTLKLVVHQESCSSRSSTAVIATAVAAAVVWLTFDRFSLTLLSVSYFQLSVTVWVNFLFLSVTNMRTVFFFICCVQVDCWVIFPACLGRRSGGYWSWALMVLAKQQSSIDFRLGKWSQQSPVSIPTAVAVVPSGQTSTENLKPNTSWDWECDNVTETEGIHYKSYSLGTLLWLPV